MPARLRERSSRRYLPVAAAAESAPDQAVAQEIDILCVGGAESVVGYHENGAVTAFIDPPQAFKHIAAGSGIESTGGLIGENNLRLRDQGTAGGSPLFLTAGQLPGIFFQMFL